MVGTGLAERFSVRDQPEWSNIENALRERSQGRNASNALKRAMASH